MQITSISRVQPLLFPSNFPSGCLPITRFRVTTGRQTDVGVFKCVIGDEKSAGSRADSNKNHSQTANTAQRNQTHAVVSADFLRNDHRRGRVKQASPSPRGASSSLGRFHQVYVSAVSQGYV